MKGYENLHAKCVYFVQRPWKICVAAFEHIPYMCGCFCKHFIFFKERVAAYERYQCATSFERKCAADIFCF